MGRFSLTGQGIQALAAGIKNDPGQPVIFGGDLTTSPWADSFALPKGLLI